MPDFVDSSFPRLRDPADGGPAVERYLSDDEKEEFRYAKDCLCGLERLLLFVDLRACDGA